MLQFTQNQKVSLESFDAHLELDSQAGQAWVSLRVRLGHAPGPLQPSDHFHHPQNRTRNGPSRQHHRARRAAANAEQIDGNIYVDKEGEVEAVEAAFTSSSTDAVDAGACTEKVAENQMK